MLDLRVWIALRHPSLVHVAFLMMRIAVGSALVGSGGSRENSRLLRRWNPSSVSSKSRVFLVEEKGEASQSKILLLFQLHINLSSLLPFSWTLSDSHIFLLKPSGNAGVILLSLQQSLLPDSYCCLLVLLNSWGLGGKGNGSALGEVEKWQSKGWRSWCGTARKSSAFSVCVWSYVGVEMGTSLEGTFFSSISSNICHLHQNNVQGPCAAGRREMPQVLSAVGKMLLQACHSSQFPSPQTLKSSAGAWKWK